VNHRPARGTATVRHPQRPEADEPGGYRQHPVKPASRRLAVSILSASHHQQACGPNHPTILVRLSDSPRVITMTPFLMFSRSRRLHKLNAVIPCFLLYHLLSGGVLDKGLGEPSTSMAYDVMNNGSRKTAALRLLLLYIL
jgi:hypothetical protein